MRIRWIFDRPRLCAISRGTRGDLVDCCHASAIAGGIRDRVVGIDGPSEIEDPEQQQDEDREHEGEFDEGLAIALPPVCELLHGLT